MISLVAFQTQSKIPKIKPIRNLKDILIYPSSPELLHNLKDQNLYLRYMTIRTYLLKPSNKIYDPRLRDYQNEDVDIMLKRPSNGLFNEQRLGKTPTVLVTLKNIKDSLKVIIIAPKSTHIAWYEEVKKWYNSKVTVINGTKKHRQDLYNRNFETYIMTYETASIDLNLLLEQNFNTIVLDEAHRIRNFKGMRSKTSPKFTKSIIKLSYECKYKFALTGTPSTNYAWDIYPILHFLYPKLFTSYFNFLNYYFLQEDVYLPNGITITKPVAPLNKSKEKELKQFLESISIQRKRKDHMIWLKNIQTTKIRLDMTPKQKKYYNELLETFECKDLNISCENNLALFIRLRQIANMGNKQSYILDYIKDYPEKSIIIASTFTSMIKELQEKIPESQLLIGETSTDNRYKLQENFNKGNIKILLCNITVIKEGMKLEKCNTLIIVDPSYTYANNIQLEDRIVLTNKNIINNDQMIIKLISKDSIDENTQVLLGKKKISTELINYFKTK